MAPHRVVIAEEAVSRYLTFLEQPVGVSEEAAARLRLDFILLAKEWADAEWISASAFRAMCVPEEVLVAAGVVEERRIEGRRVISVPGFSNGSVSEAGYDVDGDGDDGHSEQVREQRVLQR